MTLTILNNHHLLPVLADWSAPVHWSLTWDTEIDASLRGQESRGALRQWPRPTLSFTVANYQPEQWNDLRSRAIAALRVDHANPANTIDITGRVCVPWAGRESWPASVPTGPVTELALEDGHPWKAGDWLIVFSADERTWEVREVLSVTDSHTISFATPLTIPLASDTPIIPLFFGTLKSLPLEIEHESPVHASFELKIEGDSYQPDPWPPSGDPEPPALPIADFDHSETCLVTSLDASSSQAGFGSILIGYQWDFGDGTAGEGVVASHAYVHPGTYAITLTVRDGLKRRAQKTRNVTVVACPGDDPVIGPPVPPPGDPPGDEPDGNPSDPPPGPPDPPPDPPTPPPPPPVPSPEDYPDPPWPLVPTSGGDPIAPPGFGL